MVKGVSLGGWLCGKVVRLMAFRAAGQYYKFAREIVRRTADKPNARNFTRAVVGQNEQLAVCKTLASKLGTRMQPFEYRPVRYWSKDTNGTLTGGEKSRLESRC